MSDVLYLYGFAPAGPAPPVDLRGIADRQVEVIAQPEFGAVVTRLPVDSYRADVVQQQLRDVAWVADQAVAHERVVAWFVDHADIIPVPLLTLYSSEAALRDATNESAAQVRQRLERFRGLREWDLKVSYRPDVFAQNLGAVSPEVASLDTQIGAAAPGRRFLLEKKRADVVRTETTRAARQLADQLLEALRPLASQTVQLSPQRTEADLPVALSAAFLVDGAAAASLRAGAQKRGEALEPLGIVLQLSGPWAPYRFLGDADA